MIKSWTVKRANYIYTLVNSSLIHQCVFLTEFCHHYSLRKLLSLASRSASASASTPPPPPAAAATAGVLAFAVAATVPEIEVHYQLIQSVDGKLDKGGWFCDYFLLITIQIYRFLLGFSGSFKYLADWLKGAEANLYTFRYWLFS